jgi:hypothetical protein
LKIRPLRKIDAAPLLRDQKVEVEIASPVSMDVLVDRHPIDERHKVGPMVEVEASQQILVGFALARMRGDGQAVTVSSN